MLGTGYVGFASDLWSLGIILFSFVFGALPFSYCGDDYARVYEAAIGGELYFPHRLTKGAFVNFRHHECVEHGLC